MNTYTNDFSQLPFNLVYAVYDPAEKLDIFASLIRDCIENHKTTRAMDEGLRSSFFTKEKRHFEKERSRNSKW